MRRWLVTMLAVAIGFPVLGGAPDVIVTAPGARKVGVDLSRFSAPGEFGNTFLRTLENDLRLSGWFTVVRGGGAIVVTGSLADSDDNLTARCEVVHTPSGKRYLKESYVERKTDVRRLAHTVADAMVKSIKGGEGIASTRIVMVGSRRGSKNLYLVDADGAGLVQLTRDNSPCLAPSWTRDGRRILYTSFHGGFPDVYEINLTTSLRSRISAFPGINSGAAMAPNGREIVLALSKDGNPDLYILVAGARRPERLTQTADAAEASPSWSPDGKRVVYVSDRWSRVPHLYVTDRNGTKSTRLTFRGEQNVAPEWGINGLIVYSSRIGGRYQICVIDPVRGSTQQLTDDGFDHEDPSWAPDGRHIVYSRTAGNRSDLYILDMLGDPQVRLTNIEGDWLSPSWSPTPKGNR